VPDASNIAAGVPDSSRCFGKVANLFDLHVNWFDLGWRSADDWPRQYPDNLSTKIDFYPTV